MPDGRPTSLQEILVRALAEYCGSTTVPNPAWDRKAEKRAWAEDREYDVPEVLPATLDQLREMSTLRVVTAADGLPSMASAFVGEIVDVILRRIEAEPLTMVDHKGRLCHMELVGNDWLWRARYPGDNDRHLTATRAILEALVVDRRLAVTREAECTGCDAYWIPGDS